ncbi:hypothetical protein [Haloarcula pellucida]|uniref:Uncharacterized protein n=1 Tax=Haloarcula pellucida TaxID=1427151 RepID=A0A830GPD1_9EURY|nr:hypothetical protein [Halomicroarcula pellucida]GGN94596.1 hypothetical protein GCM10009030_21080 [Halomicroarcula pellucida]
MMEFLKVVFARLGKAVEAVLEPLRADPESDHFRLSSPETHTTTIDGDVGWGRRPPAVVRCPRCGADIDQRDARDDIDCSRCVAEFSHEDFPELALQYLVCPVCGNRMEHGQRHPHALDVPEWATCHGCRYHWEFRHSY